MSEGSTDSRAPYVALALLYVAFCISFIDRAAMSLALAQVSKEFNFQAAELGIVLSAFYLGYAIMQLPGGWLADRFGSKFVVIGTITLWSIFTVATSFAWSLTSLIAIRFLFGIAEGGFPSASIKGVSELFTKRERPKMSTLLLSSNYVGSMIAPLIMAPMLIYFGWRVAFELIGVLGLIFGVAYYFAVPYSKPVAANVQDTSGKTKAGARELMRNPLLWQLLIVWFGLSCVNKGLDAWMPMYLLQQRGLDLKAVGLLTPLPFIMATISTAIGGWVMVKAFPEREKYLLMFSSALTGVFLYFMYKSETVAGVIFFQSVVYFFKSFVFATVFALPTKLLSDNQIGTGIGMVNLGGQSAGFVAPLVMGFLVSMFGTYDAAFQFLLAAIAVSTVVAVTIRTSAPSAVEKFA